MNPVDHSDAIQRLAHLDSCALSDSLDKLGLNGTVTGLTPLSVARRISGRIVTVRLVEASKVPPAGAAARHLGARAIELAQPGDVIVIEQRTGVVAGSWGGILSTGAKVRGIAGVISDGLVRDVDEARALDFPIYARGSTSLTARGRVAELETGGAVQIADLTICSGDYVVADSTGVVFVPSGQIDLALSTAESIAAREAAMSKLLLEGMAVSRVMGADYEEMLRR
jgi:4-hydroxy-4-methyl-2-oxoglutarate aldolase